MASNSNAFNEESASNEDVYNINLVPSELFLKFRKEMEGFRVGLNLEFYNFQGNEYQAKLVLKPLAADRKWKFMYEPIQGDIRLLSKKIRLNKYLNLQVGIGHNYHHNAIGWKWKLSTCLGGDGVSQIRNKTSIGLFPGFDLRFGWRAEYVLPEIHGAMGTGEPIFNMNCGRLNASLDRVEAIVTHST
ncbi:OBP3-responsive protein 4 (ORG4) [Tasmannia lanceolata]|uniref:OBP3-responsive protein 4 (ORG4) n=1 Tax=Tasmannia lanceolata TaxID=3420 RepID=UPI0040632CA0